MKKVAIGSDHAGFELKKQIIEYLGKSGFEVKDCGTYSEESVDYPDFGHAVADVVESGEIEFGIIMCGSANGISMSANKHQGIRSAICWNEEIATLARLHNDANILALPARFISPDEAIKCVDTFFNTEFEGGRHQGRVEKISC